MTVLHGNYTGTDLWLPRAFVRNAFAAAIADASSEDTDFLAVGVKGPQTYGGWKPTALPAWVRLTVSAATSINYVACYVSAPEGCEFKAQRLSGMSWVDCGTSITPTTKGPLVWYFDAVNAEEVWIYVTGSTMPTIANVKAGLATVFPVGIPPGFVPGALNPEDELSGTRTNGGQILSAEVIRSGFTESVTLDRLEPSWVRSDWPVFRTAVRTEGVYFAWDIDDYPNEVVYGMVDGQPSTSYSSATFMNASFTIKGPSA